MAGRKGQRSGGHNAKTTAEHMRDGTYNATRHANRADATPAAGIPIKPVGLSDVAERVWSEMVSHLPPAALGSADTLALRECARWYELYSRTMEQFEADPLDKDLRGATKDAWDRFWSIAKDFGATPVARARLQLHGDDGKPDSPMDKLRELMASRN